MVHNRIGDQKFMKYLVAPLVLLLSACGLYQPADGCEVTSSDRSAWYEAVRMNSPDSYKAYLADYPNGCFATTATSQLRKAVERVELQALTGTGSTASSGRVY
jgi:hypothetical protein